MTFRPACTFTAFLCLALFAVLLLLPALIYVLFQIEAAPTADFLARRAAMLFLGFAVIAYLGRNITDRQCQVAIGSGVAISMAGLAALGVFEFVRGFVGHGIWIAVTVEVIIALTFARIVMRRSD